MKRQGQEFEVEQVRLYGSIWTEEREAGNDVIIIKKKSVTFILYHILNILWLRQIIPYVSICIINILYLLT